MFAPRRIPLTSSFFTVPWTMLTGNRSWFTASGFTFSVYTKRNGRHQLTNT